jgi:hypothetical protein
MCDVLVTFEGQDLASIAEQIKAFPSHESLSAVAVPEPTDVTYTPVSGGIEAAFRYRCETHLDAVAIKLAAKLAASN